MHAYNAHIIRIAAVGSALCRLRLIVAFGKLRHLRDDWPIANGSPNGARRLLEGPPPQLQRQGAERSVVSRRTRLVTAQSNCGLILLEARAACSTVLPNCILYISTRYNRTTCLHAAHPCAGATELPILSGAANTSAPSLRTTSHDPPPSRAASGTDSSSQCHSPATTATKSVRSIDSY